MRPTLWTTTLLLLVAVFVVGCDGETTQVSDKTQESSSTTTQAPKKVAEEKPKPPEGKTTTSLPQQTFTIIDEKEGGVTGTDVQRFDATILVTDKSDSGLIALTERLKNHYSQYLGTHRAVNFYFFDDKAPASEYLRVSDEESIDLDKVMVANYSFEKTLGLDDLYAQENGTPRILKDFSK